MRNNGRFFAVLFVMCLALSLFIACDDSSNDDDDNDNNNDDASPVDDDTSPADDDDDTATDDDNDDNDNDTSPADDDDDDDDATPEALSITHAFPPVAEPGEYYEYQFAAVGGTPPYSAWLLDNGALPTGLSLDANTGLLSGTVAADLDEVLFYFVITVQDATSVSASISVPKPTREPATARQVFGIRVGDPQIEGPLLQKARAYQENYELRHNCDGLSVTSDNPDDPNGDYWFSDLGDACFIHGNASAGAAFQYAVEPTAKTLANAQLHARGLDLLHRVTGVSGLLARSYMPQDAPMAPGEFEIFWPDSENHYGEGEFADYYWKGDVSIDQYSGALVGLAYLYDLVPDESVRTPVRNTVVAIADHLWDNDLRVIDADGEPTTYGWFQGWNIEGFPAPNGLTAAASLSWFKLAYRVSGEQRFHDYYEELYNEQRYEMLANTFCWVFMGYNTTWYNVYMGFENMHTITRLEDDPLRQVEFIDGFTRQLWESNEDSLAWRRGEDWANPTYTAWYYSATGIWKPDAILDAIWQMDVFVDAPLRDHYVENSSNPDIEKNPEKPEWALNPLPVNLHVPDMCMWHRNPYALDGGEDNGRERTGHDYLLPYWMGRYFGFIGPEW